MAAKKKGWKEFFTLTELIVVVIILAILVTLAFPTFRSAVKHSRDKEARSMLRLIAQAEEMYKLETGGSYIDCSDTGDCNTKLDLSIASGASAGWGYSVTTGDNKATFTATATPTKSTISDYCYFKIENGKDEFISKKCPNQ